MMTRCQSKDGRYRHVNIHHENGTRTSYCLDRHLGIVDTSTTGPKGERRPVSPFTSIGTFNLLWNQATDLEEAA